MTDPHPIDRLLTDFYRHEMPAPWPAARTVPTTVRFDSTRRSRLTLAESVAALFGFGLVISAGLPTPQSKPAAGTNLLPGSTANGERMLLPRPAEEPPPMPMP